MPPVLNGGSLWNQKLSDLPSNIVEFVGEHSLELRLEPPGCLPMLSKDVIN